MVPRRSRIKERVSRMYFRPLSLFEVFRESICSKMIFQGAIFSIFYAKKISDTVDPLGGADYKIY